MWCTPEEHRKLEKLAWDDPELDDGKALTERLYRLMQGCVTTQQKKVALNYLNLVVKEADKQPATYKMVNYVLQRVDAWGTVGLEAKRLKHNLEVNLVVN